MLVTQTERFGATAQHKVVMQGNVNAPHGNFGAGVRTIKAVVLNDGDKDVVVDLDGSEVDTGYGQAWTTRQSITVLARSKGVLEGAIRGTENFWRIAVQCAAGEETSGLVEVFDMSDNLVR